MSDAVIDVHIPSYRRPAALAEQLAQEHRAVVPAALDGQDIHTIADDNGV